MIRRFRIPILLVALIALAIYLFGVRWRPLEQVTRSHARLIGSIEEKKWSRCRDLIAPDYGDRWGFDRRDLGLALEDVGSQFFIVLDMNWETDGVTFTDDGTSCAVTGHGRIEGKGSPLATAIESQAARYADDSFTFHWKKQSWLPWDWKLRKIEHPTIAVPSGYAPGDLGRADSLF